MAWHKSEYKIIDSITFSVPDHKIQEVLDVAGKGPNGNYNEIAAIKALRDESMCEGPFGMSIRIGLRDAKEIIEDYILNNT